MLFIREKIVEGLFVSCKRCTVLQTAVRKTGNKVLDQAYVPHKVEFSSRDENYFHPAITSSKPFTMILPPPNITGNLHLGHALTVTIQDVLMRWKRMQGVETVWVPGIDHAGIATQVVVEKQLWKKSRKTRHDIGREGFETLLWEWKRKKESVIENQLRRLNASLDWSRKVFTMDPVVSQAVITAFVELFDAGLLYRADSLVNWSCTLQSAISDIEVDHVSVNGPMEIQVPGYEKPVKFGKLYKFAYKVVDSEEELVVATTRPETVLGDVAVAVNPADERYSRFVGRSLRHPFRAEHIPVISDQFVDMQFGTGAVKVTPAHDANDFSVAERHGLQLLQVIDESGELNSNCGKFAGMKRFDARDAVLEDLGRRGLMRGIKDHQMIVPICSRSGDVVELLVKPQWFLKCKEMASRAAEDVRDGRLAVRPKQFEKIWFNWLENIRDWCVSRQLWWGHRIPAYLCHPKQDTEKKVWVAAKNLESAKKKASVMLKSEEDMVECVQDNDVLDTWFSSALLPFAAFGWPHETEEFKRYYPLSLMETGHDILFFWVARMVMLGSYLTKQLPFDEILLHGIICDSHGRKMSKSLGNVVAPEDVINGASLQELKLGVQASHDSGILSQEDVKKALEGQKKMFPDGIPECGADALRFTLCSHDIKSHFINFDVQECHVNKLFCNKIWQATKFTNMWTDKVRAHQNLTKPSMEELHMMDKWILSRLSLMVNTVNNAIGKYDFYVATSALKEFLYYNFCDIYLESVKRGLRSCDSPVASAHCWTLTFALDVGLRCLAPFMPVLAQHLHSRLATFPGVVREVSFPKHSEGRDEILEKQVESLMKIVTCVRRLKKTFKVAAKHSPQAYICVRDGSLPQQWRDVIQDLTGCCGGVHTISSTHAASLDNTVMDTVDNATVHLTVPDELKKSFEADLSKLRQKRDKLQKELDKVNTVVSSQGYREKATPETAEMYRKRISALEEKIQRIDYMERLSR